MKPAMPRSTPVPLALFHFAASWVACALLASALGIVAPAQADPAADAINQRLYRQLDDSPSRAKIETISGQLYISEKNIDARVISDALAAMLEGGQGSEQAVAVQRTPRLNFEIHFKKNSADLTEASKASLDQLAQSLGQDFPDMKFILGGHTDQDGDPEVNGPLSQARADSARAYLVGRHAIAAERLVARGFGAAEPLRAVESNPQDKLYNRRVDLRPLR